MGIRNGRAFIKMFRTVQDLFLDSNLKKHGGLTESNQEIWLMENSLRSSTGIHTFPFQASVVNTSIYKGKAKGGGQTPCLFTSFNKSKKHRDKM